MTIQPYQEEINANLGRAEEALQVAQLLFEEGHFDFVASCAYYSVFYAATAMLLSEGLEFKKHSGLIAAVHQHFVKTGRLAQEIGKSLNWLFELRMIADYGEIRHVPENDAKEAISAAKRFIDTVKTLKKNQTTGE